MKRLALSLAAASLLATSVAAPAQDYGKYSDDALRAELKRVAVTQTNVLVPMRDGVRLVDQHLPAQGREGAAADHLVEDAVQRAQLRGSDASATRWRR